ncbi:MAG: ABC transporter ATP-binding protein, partial [Gammaproteobacteria bacterium]|nr:ABC transporter ATP-binding protein [Gammaproteobacteria bacterium]
SDWLAQRPAPSNDAKTKVKAPVASAPAAPPPAVQPPRKKLSYKDQRDLELLPQRIEQLEQQLQQLQQQLADPGLYQTGAARVAQLNTEIAALESELAAAYARWEELEA